MKQCRVAVLLNRQQTEEWMQLSSALHSPLISVIIGCIITITTSISGSSIIIR